MYDYDMFGCTGCGSALCDGDCPESWENYRQETAELSDHYALCKKESCYICQCL